jgi:hypothetical protein
MLQERLAAFIERTPDATAEDLAGMIEVLVSMLRAEKIIPLEGAPADDTL